MQPLADIKVLDLTWHVAGPYATKLLADWGAEVLKVERPGTGDPARSYGPFPNDQPHPERSGAFLHLNTNKRSVTINLKSTRGKEIVRDLAIRADVVVENFSPGTLSALGLDYSSLSRGNPDLVMCSITNFGQTGPYRDWKATEFTLSALAGLIGPRGSGGRPPLKSADHLQEYQGGSTAAVAIMGAVFHHRRGGDGQHIDVSLQELASNSADRRLTFLTGYAYTGTMPYQGEPTPSGAALPIGIYPCKDGYVSLMVSPPIRWMRLMEMLGRPELIHDPAMYEPEFWTRPEAKDLVDSLLFPWLMERTKQQVMEDAQGARIGCAPVNTAPEVLEDKHWRERGYWAEADHPEAGRLPYTGPSYRAPGDGWRLKTTAPLLGRHNQEVLSGYLGYSSDKIAELQKEGAI